MLSDVREGNAVEGVPFVGDEADVAVAHGALAQEVDAVCCAVLLLSLESEDSVEMVCTLKLSYCCGSRLFHVNCRRCRCRRLDTCMDRCVSSIWSTKLQSSSRWTRMSTDEALQFVQYTDVFNLV